MTVQEGNIKFDFKRRCTNCGELGICIKEGPHGVWECRDCYSGMTQEERREKIREIIKGLENKSNNLEDISDDDIPF